MLLARPGPCSLSLPDLPIIAQQALPQSTGQFWLEPCGSGGQAGVSSKHDLLAKHWNGEKLPIDSSLPISLHPALALSLCCPWGGGGAGWEGKSTSSAEALARLQLCPSRSSCSMIENRAVFLDTCDQSHSSAMIM